MGAGLGAQGVSTVETLAATGLSLVATAMAVAVLGVIALLALYLLTLPLRRRERARLFLSLLETGLREGRGLSEILVSLSRWNVRALGNGLHAVAQAMSAGATFAEALGDAPGFMPPQVAEMLAAGERLGDLPRVLPACRRTLADALSSTRGAMNYMILGIFGLAGLFGSTLVVLPGIAIYILPRLGEMFADMNVEPPVLFRATVAMVRNPLLYGAVLLIPMGLLLFLLFYAGGPWLVSVLRLRGVAGWVHYRVPWRRKRLQRDFSAMLGVLLDAGVPEAEALRMAATCTANTVFARRADAVATALAGGTPLTEAVARLDDTGEFRWRLANAAHAGTAFSQALAGWHQALDARAFQLEQVAAQAVTSAVVVLNGLVVAALAIGFFQCLIGLIWGLLLW